MSTKQPNDKSYFILPDLGEGVHEAELVKWRVKPGEQVDEHQTLAEMETDKALVEVPSPWSGVIKDLNGAEGEIINVGSVLVTYSVDGNAAAAPAEPPAAARAQPVATAQTAAASESEDAGTVVGSVDTTLTVPTRFSRRAPEPTVVEVTRRAKATPAIRGLARQFGVDINRITGSGRGGRVTAADVEQFAAGALPAPTAAVRAATVAAVVPAAPLIVPTDGVIERIPFRGVRRKIAQALDLSVKTAVHFTVVDEADVTVLDGKRREYASVLGRKIGYLPFVITAVCRALRIHPSLNANVDDANEEILIKGAVNLGCAVDTDHGLMVPVIRNAESLSLTELSDAVATVAAQCRDRSIPREQLVGGTFTISNVGSYGGQFATPIINYPEVAILAAGRVTEKAMVSDGKFYAGKALPLSLSCDHRVVDGAEGARYLNTVVKLLEAPEELVRSRL